ncbi:MULTISPECIES: Mrp/NBP35 family ATP-binding protein [unclassified Planococcus (in: firmicutes)]|uniref:Mrp/NBP35 family ATP-binding protein n=1 Tax=Planococcus TaxID=1372 RepID=UPI000C33C6CE|nr:MULTISPECIES: Mrp/NBP35 family ATP-binding protein [unclassified Planococcus (in: firmicutes)]AUD12652.1 chromosome partitioning protein ParA [Planococcus sp. MB-3u-03]PKG44512.1 chromosome partitioning protein ParA [Planococcus sp. Urea-trap-24]PKG91405.1 chromosome partitioning protein ParA [Planococcus sp. Urea-3u-39]PKH36027.1 chromosome partitioning protein ParA [Planococcus sp. MB-3u-09]
MLSETQVREAVGALEDPFLHRTLSETNGILSVKIKEEKKYVSVKLAIAKTNTPEQMQLQMKVVDAIKGVGADSVGIRFEELPPEALAQFRGTANESEAQDLLSPLNKVEFISIASGKGGVGKSTVSVNLAIALARAGKKVGLVDADIYGFSVPDMMGIDKAPVVRGDTIIPVERFGVKVISMGFFVEDNMPVVWRGPMLGKVLDQFFRDVEWGDLDYLLLDLPPGTGDVALDIHQMLPASKEIVVTTPHPTAAFVAARAGAMALQTNHEVLGVVENMSWFESQGSGKKEYIFGKGGGAKLAEELQAPLLGQIPLGQPDWDENDFAPSVYAENHPTGKIYGEIAQQVLQQFANKENKQ